jgi:hypothetical protein
MIPIPILDFLDPELQDFRLQIFNLIRTELKPSRLQAIGHAQSGIVVCNSKIEIASQSKDVRSF